MAYRAQSNREDNTEKDLALHAEERSAKWLIGSTEEESSTNNGAELTAQGEREFHIVAAPLSAA